MRIVPETECSLSCGAVLEDGMVALLLLVVVATGGDRLDA